VRIPAFLTASLVEEVTRGLSEASFRQREHGEIGVEDCMEPNAILARLLLVANDPSLFAAIQAIAQCGAIGCFDGRVYRLDPASDHRDSWHTDLGDNRLVAMSVNLSSNPYVGGVLEIRDRRSRRVIHEVANLRAGDALLFKIADGLEHRVTPVEGTVPRTAFAGWFKSRPSFLSVLRGGEWSVR
jgi:hypothetical protein